MKINLTWNLQISQMVAILPFLANLIQSVTNDWVTQINWFYNLW